VEFAPGTVVADRYRLEQLLGEGGMGVVWAACRLDSGEPVALKFMKAAPDRVALRRRFFREARAACAIEHPNVVRVFEILDLELFPAIVMEKLEGESLATYLDRRGPLSVNEAAVRLLPVVSAVAAAHGLGIVHRDLKPENIFLARVADGEPTIKVLDFGIAKVTGAAGGMPGTAHATTTGNLLGTPAYMSPEQVFGEKDIDDRADIWSLGMILYECVTGILPTRLDNIGQIIKTILTRDDWQMGAAKPGLPPDLVDLVSRMLLRDRSRRPSLSAIAELLARHADAELGDAFPPPLRESAQFDLAIASTQPAVQALTPEEQDRAYAGDDGAEDHRGGDTGRKAASTNLPASSTSPAIETLSSTAGRSRAPRRRRTVMLSALIAITAVSVSTWWSLSGVRTLTVAPSDTEAIPTPAANLALHSTTPAPSAVATANASASVASAPIAQVRQRVSAHTRAKPGLGSVSASSQPTAAHAASPAAPPPKPTSSSLSSSVVHKPPF
jgi:eukaryotic-like serine/threonine-protein kinase